MNPPDCDCKDHGGTWCGDHWEMACSWCQRMMCVASNVIAVNCSQEHRQLANEAGMPHEDGFLY